MLGSAQSCLCYIPFKSERRIPLRKLEKKFLPPNKSFIGKCDNYKLIKINKYFLTLRAVRQRPLLSAFMNSTKSGQENGASLLSCWSW